MRLLAKFQGLRHGRRGLAGRDTETTPRVFSLPGRAGAAPEPSSRGAHPGHLATAAQTLRPAAGGVRELASRPYREGVGLDRSEKATNDDNSFETRNLL